MLFNLARPLIFALDPERAHSMTIAGLKAMPAAFPPEPNPALSSEVAGIQFSNPVGLAPGFDKNAEVPRQMLGLGFGFVEVGTLTPLPQLGNPKPRLFRLVEDKGVVNRLGFNNQGQQAAIARLQRDSGKALPGILGINIGANKDSDDRIADYAAGVANMAGYADYLTVNISSPNTPGLRALQDKNALDELLSAVNSAQNGGEVPVFLKVAPDLEPADIDDIVEVSMKNRIAALIVSNTTISRPDLQSHHAQETGGLSGAPLRDLATQRVRDFYKATAGEIPLIGVGGISSADDAWERIKAGASLVQLYSAMVYEGPMLGAKIVSGLERLMQRDGFATIAEAVGSE